MTVNDRYACWHITGNQAFDFIQVFDFFLSFPKDRFVIIVIPALHIKVSGSEQLDD